jgi:acyl dehydratase
VSILQGSGIDDFAVCRVAELVRTIGSGDVDTFAAVAGYGNPINPDEVHAVGMLFEGLIANGPICERYIFAFIGTNLLGPGAIYAATSLGLRRPARIGDSVTTRAAVRRIDTDCHKLDLLTYCSVSERRVMKEEAEALISRRGA